jgi:galactose oxidase
MMSRTLLVAFLLGAIPARAVSQTNLGTWDPAFNHACPTNWHRGQPDWDGEPACPYLTPPLDPNRFNAGHMCLIPVGLERGKVLVWNWMRVPNGSVVGKQHWAIVDVSGATPVFQNFDLTIPVVDGDLFCSGHAWTKDGHLLVAGGNRYVGTALQANRLAFRFDPTVQPTGNLMWKRETDMSLERWYPTVTTLGTDPSGRDPLVVSGGSFVPAPPAVTYEVFDPTNPPMSGRWLPNPSGGTVFPQPAGLSCEEMFWIYPRAHVLGSGRLFFAGMSERSFRLDLSPLSGGLAPTWDVHATNPFPGRMRHYGSSFLFPNLGGPAGGLSDIVVRIAGAPFDVNPTCTGYAYGTPSPLATMEYCFADLPAGDVNWTWFQNGPSLGTARLHLNSVLLPDATVLVVGGNQDTASEFVCGVPVLKTELLNDLPFQWRSLAPATVRRGYHSTAVLLPDGRVLTGGGEQREYDYEVFRPHYLTNGTARPQILNAPPTLNMSYGQTYQLEYAPGLTVERAVLMAPASLTHHSDMHQRYFEMQTMTPPPPNPNPFFAFQAPTTSAQAPRGYYMLFLVSSVQPGANRGTPSIATWVRLQ